MAIDDRITSAAVIIDELICLFCLHDDMDYNIIDDGLKFIVEVAKENPDQRITPGLRKYMMEHGYLEKEGQNDCKEK